VYQQTKYLNNKDLGFDKEQVLFFPVRGDVGGKFQAFRSELKNSPGIVSVTSGYGLPGDQFAGDGVKLPGKNNNEEHSANVFIGDADYIKTLGLRIIAGRDFASDMAPTQKKHLLLTKQL
jgi:putative ABC transport system permease protein